MSKHSQPRLPRALVRAAAAGLAATGLALAAGPVSSAGPVPAAAPQACRAGTLYLTFDTGSMSQAALIADTLRRHHVKATFFLANEPTINKDSSLDPGWAAYWKTLAADGHVFGSHTFDHVYLRGVRDGKVTMRPQFGAHAGQDVVMDQQSFCSELNRSAQALCGQGSGLYRDGEYLAAVMPTEHRTLHEMLATLAGASQGLPSKAVDTRDPHPGQATLVPTQVLSVCAPGFALPTTLTLQPAGASMRNGLGEERALVVVSARRQGAEHAHHDCLFARQFKLSEAQARVNALVFAGHSIASLAQVLHVSENTVRSHLKQIFQKTNTHGQMELVRLHAQHCPPA